MSFNVGSVNFLVSGRPVRIPADMVSATREVSQRPNVANVENPQASRLHGEILQRSPNQTAPQTRYTLSSTDLSGRHAEFVALTSNTRQPTHKAPAPTTANDSQAFNQQRPHQSIRA